MALTPTTITSTFADLDRTQIVPSHQGPHVLPNDPLFTRLLRHAHRNHVAIVDQVLGVSKTYGELLDAVLEYREVVRAALASEVQHQLSSGSEVYFGVLAAGGYEFTVAVLTVLALGGAVVPMFPTAPADEIFYYATKSQQVAILSSSATTQLAKESAQRCGILHLDILPNLPRTTRLKPFNISISSNSPRDPSAPGVVIFTSGTTGKPKGVVLRRTYTHEGAITVGDSYGITHTDVLLHTLPVHHTTGLGTSFFPFLNAGACIEFHGKFDAGTVLQRWLQGGLTIFSAVPTIYMRLKWFIEQLPAHEQMPYKQAARQFRAFLCGSSALQEHVQDFWTATRGQPILIRYGATEIPGCIRVPLEFRDIPKGSVGQPLPGVELKISPEGELLVKTPNMFAKYLMEPETTKNALDTDGWYKTGDIARREGNFYFIEGRASVDIIKSGGYKISALDVERACLTLPYVNEAMVVGVEDDEFGQRVAAVLAVKNKNASDVTLATVRNTLRDQLAGYKLPTVLRVMEGEIPKGATGKVQKKILGPKLIPTPGYEEIPQVQVWKKKQQRPLQARL
ncbi:Malonate ligase [Fusarium pseudoanthophilum]|uniref:Malonate ligase n=1 Tax=Fusarium pseudoanthophilum TaxID=48495 RepID=A0A8H5NRS0_9HYPO|nr:Malonate ligase [Fusarium pseudoanthophilum]